LSLILLLSGNPTSAQQIENLANGRVARIGLPSSDGDTIQVVVFGSGSDLSRKKGIFLFIQGSLPNPLLMAQDTQTFSSLPFNISAWREKYHFVAVSKPGIPVVADLKNLDQRFCYLDPASGKFPDKYRRLNYLEYYLQQHTTALDWMLQQPWADVSRVVVCGGSQGATVATRLAAAHPGITHLIYYSGNPNGRLDEEVRRIQQQVATGKLNGAEATAKLAELQEYWKWLYNNAESLDDANGDPPKTTVSFSKPAREYLSGLDIPVLVAFGTADLTAAPCATLPLDFLRQGKKNLTLKVYPNYDHHFFEQKSDGSEPEYRMDTAFREWMDWIR
jgi:pimeloyl-ACP methyl ester carboxylesterase